MIRSFPRGQSVGLLAFLLLGLAWCGTWNVMIQAEMLTWRQVELQTENVESDSSKPDDSQSYVALGFVGTMQRLSDVVVSGSKLSPRPLEDRRLPIVMRIVQVRPHGDAFRYDLEFMGLEAGVFNLSDYLVRADGSQTAELPKLLVRVLSTLPEGHIPPNELKNSLPWMSRYRIWVWGAGVLWLLVFLGLIFYRRPSTQGNVNQAKPLTFAQMLKPRLQAAVQGPVDANELALLERYLVEFWRRKLGWFDRDPVSVVVDLKKHPQAGPLMNQLEQWIHARQRNSNVDLDRLLQPYQDFEASELDELKAEHGQPHNRNEGAHDL